MTELTAAAGDGLPVLGICNGFQVLCESHLLPGALLPNAGLHFVCRDQRLRVENTDTAWTSEYTEGQELVIPVKNRDGRYTADRETLIELADTGRIVARYLDLNPNGSLDDIAGICNEAATWSGSCPIPSTPWSPSRGRPPMGSGSLLRLLRDWSTHERSEPGDVGDRSPTGRAHERREPGVGDRPHKEDA